jgi:BirA family biotin operon repressor/biotin-[acetyl-CoA-carboxylase] ligase
MEMAINWILERVEESPSTNEDLMARWRQGLLWEPVARLALKQTSGKGRMGRQWVSTPNETLTFSVAYPFKKPISALSGLSLACGLAIIRGISQATNLSLSELQNHQLALKWPNDILLKKKKLAGMLIEGGQLRPEDPTWLIIGIGINLANSQHIDHQIGRPIGALTDIFSKDQLDADLLWLSLIKELGAIIEKFETGSFADFHDEWNQWDAYKNETCQIHQNSNLQYEGINQGVDNEGCLILKTSTGIKKIISGDVSLRSTS